MKSEEYIQALRHLEWLKDISKQYEEHLSLMEREKGHYTVQGIVYTARSEGRTFHCNSHRPIPARYIYEGLTNALWDVNAEIEDLERKLKQVTVEL